MKHLLTILLLLSPAVASAQTEITGNLIWNPDTDTFTGKWIQAQLDAAEKKRLSEPPKFGAVYAGAQAEVKLPFGEYVLSKPLRVSHYTRISGDGAILKADKSFPEGRYAIESSEAWQCHFDGITFKGINGFKLSNNNLDQGSIRITNCASVGGDEFLRLDCRSTKTVIEKFRCDKTKRVATIVSGDSVTFRDGWISQPDLTKDEQVSIEILPHESPQTVRLENVDAFPGQVRKGVKNTAWIANRGGTVRAVLSRFSGEYGGISVVNNYKQADSTYPVIPVGVDLVSCEVFATDGGKQSGAIRLFAVPNFLTVKQCSGFVASRAVVFAPDVQREKAVEDAKGEFFGGACTVTVRDNAASGAWPDFVPRELEAGK